MERKRILSCIQPTGHLHLGRYLGAVENWVNLQADYDCLFGVVNYHAQTMPFESSRLRELTWDVSFKLLACGIHQNNIFIQSLVPEHTELNWILSCFTSYGELSRMTQFKDKSQQLKEADKEFFISAGLFSYPILQAADIIIYHAHYVPVGKDQEQHLELSRNIALRFNQGVGQEYFPLPEPLFTKIPKVMSTADPTRKMSASLGEKHNIDIFAAPEKIRKQIMSAVTDSGDVQFPQMSPGVENLLAILKNCGAQEIYENTFAQYQQHTLLYGHLKKTVAEVVIAKTQPFRDNFYQLLNDRQEVENQIRVSSAKIRERAQKTLREVKALTGLI